MAETAAGIKGTEIENCAGMMRSIVSRNITRLQISGFNESKIALCLS